MTDPQPTPGPRIEGLDVLRGLAISLVLLRHALPAPFAGAGVVGVVMFFALSGHLITGLLLGELDRTGRVDLRRFYLRRAVRLVPALAVMLAGFALVTLTVDPLHDRGRLAVTLAKALTWTSDVPFGRASDAAFHLWTLATEEQFYLVWPLVLVLAVRHRRLGRALGLTAAACLLGCVATLVWLRGAPDLAYPLPTSWSVCFVIGAATRVYADRVPYPTLLRPTVRDRLVPSALLGLGVLSVVPLRGHPLTYLAGGPAIAALTGVLLLRWRHRQVVTGPVSRALVWLGAVSYAAYLWDYPLTLWLRPSMGVPGVLLAAGLTLLLAAASRRHVELPAQRWARRHLLRDPAGPAVVRT